MIQTKMGMGGTLTAKLIKGRERAPLAWHVRNVARLGFLGGLLANKAARLLSKVTSLPVLTSELRAVHILADGRRIDHGVVCRRVVTTAGITYLRDDFNNGGQDVSTINFHGCGTGAVAEAAGDTALGAESTTILNPDSTRATGTRSVPAANQFQSVGTLTFDGSGAITEHGIFSAASAGTLWDRSVFSAINVASGDSIQFTYVLTITGS
jgi:hypothetical protein